MSRGGETRTPGLYVPNVARYQLRHTPILKNLLFHNVAFSVPNVARYQLRHTPIMKNRLFHEVAFSVPYAARCLPRRAQSDILIVAATP